MLSPNNNVNFLSLKILFNLKSLQINNHSVFLEEKEMNNIIKKAIFNLGFKEIIVSDKLNTFTNINTRKRSRDDLEIEDFFEKKNWISPSRIRNFMNDPFEGLLKENPSIMVLEEEPVYNIYFEKGYEYEKFVINHLIKKYPIATVMKDIPNPEPVKFKETISLMQSGCPIIYQGLLMDGENKIYGCPDLIIRTDYLKKIFPKMTFGFELKKSNINQYYYSVVDIKFKTLDLIGNKNELSFAKKYQGDIMQVSIYQDIINKIQGEFNHSYLLGKRCLKKSKGIKFSGLEILGEINYDNKKMHEIKNIITMSMKEIKELRARDEGFTFSNLPKRYHPNVVYKNTNFPKNKEYFKENFMPKIEVINQFNFTYVKQILNEIPDDRLLIFLDFETVDSDLIKPMKEIPTNFNSTYLSQIGFFVPKLDEYFSMVSEKITYESEYENLWKFVNFTKLLEKNFNQKVVLVTYGNYEEINYEKLADFYNLPDFEFIDLLKIFRFYNLKHSGSYSLKTLAKEFSMFYSDKFTLNYNDSSLSSGADAMHLMMKYYQSSRQEEKDKILAEVEHYNELDCKIMYEIIEFLKQKQIKN